MQTISFLIPCYNERDNIRPMISKLIEIMAQYHDKYDYEIIYRDNASTDGSVDVLRELAKENERIKVIVNARNYGHNYRKESFIGRVSGDVIIYIAGDLQEPPELIPTFIEWYEKGYEAVCGEKIGSKEGSIKYGLRQLFYRIINLFSDYPQYENLSGIILLSKRINDIYWNNNDYPAIRYFLSDLGCKVKLIKYIQNERKYGKTSYNAGSAFSFAMNSLIQTSLKPLRLATVLGIFMSFFSFLIGFVYLIVKLIYWDRFSAGVAPVLIGLFFIGSVLLLFIGIVGEYVGSILNRIKASPPPIVSELINFCGDDPYCIKQPDDQNGDIEIE